MKDLFAYENVTTNYKLNVTKIVRRILDLYNVGVTRLNNGKRVLFIANIENELYTIDNFRKEVASLIRNANPGKFTTIEINNLVSDKLFAELILYCETISNEEFYDTYFGEIDIKTDLKKIDTKPMMKYFKNNKYKKEKFHQMYGNEY